MKDLALSIGGTVTDLSGTPILTPIPVKVPYGILTGNLGTVGKDLIQLAFTIFFVVAVLAVIILVLYSGIQWILSEGDKTKVQAARDRLTYTIIGLLVIMFSFFIVRAVIEILGGNPKFFFSF